MLFHPATARIQTSGKLKVRVLRREKMKKILMPIVVLGLVTLAADRTGLSSNNAATADNIPVVTSPDVVLGIQSDDGSVCVVYLKITDAGRPEPVAASAQLGIIHQLPDMTTLVLLGFGGLLYRRRKE
jgi:hypothetical protein